MNRTGEWHIANQDHGQAPVGDLICGESRIGARIALSSAHIPDGGVPCTKCVNLEFLRGGVI